MQDSVSFEEIQCQIILKFILKKLNLCLKRIININLAAKKKASLPNE